MSYEIFDFRVKAGNSNLLCTIVFLGQHLECRPLDPTLVIWTNFVKEKLIYLLFFTPF